MNGEIYAIRQGLMLAKQAGLYFHELMHQVLPVLCIDAVYSFAWKDGNWNCSVPQSMEGGIE
jgi:hypothetical protein